MMSAKTIQEREALQWPSSHQIEEDPISTSCNQSQISKKLISTFGLKHLRNDLKPANGPLIPEMAIHPKGALS